MNSKNIENEIRELSLELCDSLYNDFGTDEMVLVRELLTVFEHGEAISILKEYSLSNQYELSDIQKDYVDRIEKCMSALSALAD